MTQISSASPNHKTAIFAGGCFWCVEAAFDYTEGVIETTSGYTGGDASNADYKQVASGSTQHYEALLVKYDASKTNYKAMLKTFWYNIDPTDTDGQFADKGRHYQTAIFYANEDERLQAEQSKSEIAKFFDAPIVTKIIPAGEFYKAEEYHQDYHKKQPDAYQRYYKGSGRKGFVEGKWGK